ncbi:MAG TPA: hypothetical protein VHK69_08055 [Chitinophagaceae bacterium]|jgi:hypothetical protein|nr:hypothetical protein [Chitinophagaceae bacterium]
MNTRILCVAAALFLAGCSKGVDAVAGPGRSVTNPTAPSASFTRYLIKKGEHSTQSNVFRPVELDSLRFTVRFDSSAVYRTAVPANQYDINKLYGFSDNADEHHRFSARFGWSWNNGALRLYAYVYNNGVRASKELGTMAIGAEAECAIRVTEAGYGFMLNGTETVLPRASKTPRARGYQLYPYFGGDEPAPHDVSIWIKNR